MALRTCVMTIRVPQFFTSRQSSQGRYAVALAHGSGANGPSKRRMREPIVTSAGGLRSRYPPPRPVLLSSKPCDFKSARIPSRNLAGIFSCWARVAIRTGFRPYSRLRASIACRPYFVRLAMLRTLFFSVPLPYGVTVRWAAALDARPIETSTGCTPLPAPAGTW